MSSLQRHFEGWPLAVVAVGIALIGAMLVVPRHTEPEVIPFPEPSPAAGARERTAERERARIAAQTGLPYAVRAVGELIRRYGALSARGDHGSAQQLLDDLPRAARSALSSEGPEPLLGLRATQTELFVQALARWEAQGAGSRELDELGGDFVARAVRNGWVTCGLLVLEDDERRAAFRMRWARLLGLADRHPFSPTLEDWRVYYRALLRHPELDGAPPIPALMARRRLEYVRALERHDPEYPALLARGVLYLALDDHPSAAQALEQFLTTHPDGRWQLRARNHLATALRGAPQGFDAP